MIRIVGQCLESQNETGARQLFDVFETLLILVCRMHSGGSVSADVTALGNSLAQPSYS
jgi:hypothetical protein